MNQQPTIQEITTAILSGENYKKISKNINSFNITEDEKRLLLEKVIETIEFRINYRLAGILTDKDVETIGELNKDIQAEEKVEKFMQEKSPNIEAIIQEELQSFLVV